MNEAAVTAITSSVDFSPVITGIGTIGAAVALVLISIRGMRILLSGIKS